MRTTLLSLVAVVAVLVTGAIPAAAATYSSAWFEDTHTGLTDWGDNPPNPIINLTFPQFNGGAIYTLTRIDWEMWATADEQWGFENVGPTSADGSETVWITATWTKPGGGLFSTLAPTISSGTIPLAAYDGTLDFAGDSGETVHPAAVTTSTANWFGSGDPSFDLFKGPLTVLTPVSAITSYAGGGGGGQVLISHHTTGTIRGRIKYTYDDDVIPEPGTTALFLSGLAAVGLLRRRRRTE